MRKVSGCTSNVSDTNDRTVCMVQLSRCMIERFVIYTSCLRPDCDLISAILIDGRCVIYRSYTQATINVCSGPCNYQYQYRFTVSSREQLHVYMVTGRYVYSHCGRGRQVYRARANWQNILSVWFLADHTG